MTSEINEKNAFETFMKCARFLGWNCIAIPKVGDDEHVPGVVIGRDEYVTDILAGKYKEEDFSKIGEKELDKQN